jgi:hypothetical protein
LFRPDRDKRTAFRTFFAGNRFRHVHPLLIIHKYAWIDK